MRGSRRLPYCRGGLEPNGSWSRGSSRWRRSSSNRPPSCDGVAHVKTQARLLGAGQRAWEPTAIIGLAPDELLPSDPCLPVSLDRPPAEAGCPRSKSGICPRPRAQGAPNARGSARAPNQTGLTEGEPDRAASGTWGELAGDAIAALAPHSRFRCRRALRRRAARRDRNTRAAIPQPRACTFRIGPADNHELLSVL